MARLKGDCSQCGLCCFSFTPEGEALRCQYLKVNGTPGAPMATECLAYASRSDGMYIFLIDKDGRVRGHTQCARESEEETAVIVEQGIGKGCSLEIA